MDNKMKYKIRLNINYPFSHPSPNQSPHPLKPIILNNHKQKNEQHETQNEKCLE